jgi:dTDP-4-amino-4,6-dideoxygalactose transaminase
MSKPSIPYNRPPVEGKELTYLQEVISGRHFSGDGPFTKRCTSWLEENLKAKKALITHSCTAAMEMSAILCDLRAGDEVIMPSFTFSSTANAVVLRGAVPVFLDLRTDTMNLDEKIVEAAITPRTRAIFAVHYAGVACEMDTLLEIAQRRQLLLLEDAAQGMLSTYKGRPLGTIGHLGSLSFHETKNVVSGEGGALLINDARYDDRAEIIREKGTNRRQFLRGQVDKYTWVDLGSSYLPSEFITAVLFAQLEKARAITDERLGIWGRYHAAFADLETKGYVRRPTIPTECGHNGHIYYLLAGNLTERTDLIAHLKAQGIGAPFHYVPLHSTPAGRKYGRTHGPMARTDSHADRLLRLPLWVGLSESDQAIVIEQVHAFYRAR